MAETIDVKVPDIGDFDEVEIIEVLVSKGDTVNAEDPLITLETDKAAMDVPSPSKGTIEEVTVKVGDRVSEGTVIARLSGAGDAEADAEESSDSEKSDEKPDESGKSDESGKPDETEKPEKPEETEKSSDSGKSDTESEAGSESEEKTEERAKEKSTDDADKARNVDTAPAEAAHRGPPASLPPPVERAGGALPHASPGVRRFARELGADLNQIRGSGPKGRILKSDVKEFVKSRLSEPVTATLPSTGGAGIPAMPEVDFSKFGEIEALDTPRIKKLSGAHLHRAWLNIPHVTHHDEADITDLEAFRNQINDEQARAKSGIKVTLLAFAMKAVASALRKFPLLNSSLSPDGQKLIYKKYFHIGIAVDTPNGLVVPVFRDVDKKGVLDLAAEMSEVSTRARDGKLKPTEMQGGCMSISSLGGIGGTAFTPIVNAPEVAILGLTRARMTPVWNEQEFVPRLMLPVDLSYDHRVVDGAEAARFAAWLCRALGDPRRLLL